MYIVEGPNKKKKDFQYYSLNSRTHINKQILLSTERLAKSIIVLPEKGNLFFLNHITLSNTLLFDPFDVLVFSSLFIF